MRTIEFLPTKSRIATSRETLDIFAPIAHRLGMAQIRWEMEDHAFHELHPREYIQIAERRGGTPWRPRKGYHRADP